MGKMYRISCATCGISCGVSEGRGMFYGNSFERLFLNYMDKSDRINFAGSLPKQYRNEVKDCSYRQEPLRCTKCRKFASKLVWRVELKGGWSYSPPLKCESCSAELERFTLPPDGDFEDQCWECEGKTLNIECYMSWD